MVTIKNFVTDNLTVVWSRRERIKEGVQCLRVAPYMDLQEMRFEASKYVFFLELTLTLSGRVTVLVGQTGKIVGHYFDFLQIYMVKN